MELKFGFSSVFRSTLIRNNFHREREGEQQTKWKATFYIRQRFWPAVLFVTKANNQHEKNDQKYLKQLSISLLSQLVAVIGALLLMTVSVAQKTRQSEMVALDVGLWSNGWGFRG